MAFFPFSSCLHPPFPLLYSSWSSCLLSLHLRFLSPLTPPAPGPPLPPPWPRPTTAAVRSRKRRPRCRLCQKARASPVSPAPQPIRPLLLPPPPPSPFVLPRVRRLPRLARHTHAARRPSVSPPACKALSSSAMRSPPPRGRPSPLSLLLQPALEPAGADLARVLQVLPAQAQWRRIQAKERLVPREGRPVWHRQSLVFQRGEKPRCMPLCYPHCLAAAP